MNRRNVNTAFVFSLLLSWVLFSCGKNTAKPSELIKWVEDEENGLTQSREIGAFRFEALYKPTDYVVAIEGRTDQLTEARYNNLKSELGDLQYVDLKIGRSNNDGNALSGGAVSDEEYFQRLDYFVTWAHQDIQMIQGEDTLSPALYHFERNYGLAPYNTILLGFDKSDPKEDKTLLIKDQILGVGKLRFEFEADKIASTPKLKTI